MLIGRDRFPGRSPRRARDRVSVRRAPGEDVKEWLDGINGCGLGARGVLSCPQAAPRQVGAHVASRAVSSTRNCVSEGTCLFAITQPHSRRRGKEW